MTKNKESLFKHIDLFHLKTYLLAHKVITEEEKKKLLYERLTKPDEAKKIFFEILIRKGYMVFDHFLKALKDEKEYTGHATLRDILMKYKDLFTEENSVVRERRSDSTDLHREELVLNKPVARSRAKAFGGIPEENVAEIHFREIKNMIGNLSMKMDQFVLQSSTISHATYDHNEEAEEVTPLPHPETVSNF